MTKVSVWYCRKCDVEDEYVREAGEEMPKEMECTQCKGKMEKVEEYEE